MSRGQFKQFDQWFTVQLNQILKESLSSNIRDNKKDMQNLESFYNFTLKILIREIGTKQFEIGNMLSKLWSFNNIYMKMLRQFHDNKMQLMQENRDDEYNSVHLTYRSRLNTKEKKMSSLNNKLNLL